MSTSALPNYRPDCGLCGHPMNPHFGDGGDAGCLHEAPEIFCRCTGYRYPWEVA